MYSLFLVSPNTVFQESFDPQYNQSLSVKDFQPQNSVLSLITALILPPSWQNLILIWLFASLYEKQFKYILSVLNRYQITRFSIYILRKALKTVAGAFVFILLFPLFALIYFVLLFIKKIFMALTYYELGNKFTEPYGNDVIWASKQKTKIPIITVLMRFEGSLDEEYIYNRFEKLIKNKRNEHGVNPYRKFAQTFETYYGYFIWRDCDKFDVKNHVKMINLRDIYPEENFESEDMASSCADEVICKFIGNNIEMNLPSHLPQWQVLFLTKGDDREFWMVLRLHHAIGDGVALMRFLHEELADTPMKVSLLGPPPSPLQRFLTNIWSIAMIPFAFLLVLDHGTKNPLHGKPLKGEKIFVTSKAIPFDVVKDIKKRMKVTVTDVLFSCLSSSLASFYEKRNVEVPDIGIMFPIGFEDPSGPLTLSNNFGMGLTELPTLSNSSLLRQAQSKRDFPSLKRMAKVKVKLDSVKEDPTVLSVFWITDTFAAILPAFLCETLFTSAGKTLGVSNVPGLQKEMYALQRKIKEMRFWVPDREPTGAGFTIMSYSGGVRVSFSVDKALISSREEAKSIIEDFVTALKTLKSEVDVCLDPQVSKSL